MSITFGSREAPDSSGPRPALPLTFVTQVRAQPPAHGSPPQAGDRPEHIGPEGTEPTGGTLRSGEPRKRDLEEELDAALACTFPASDPIGCLGTELNCSKPAD